jgi:transcriptional regulator with XRE-family HTH domain
MEILRTSRKKRGITIKQLAEGSGLSAQRIHEYETGKVIPGRAAMVKLAKALDILDQIIPSAAFRRRTRRRAFSVVVRRDHRECWADLFSAYPELCEALNKKVPPWFMALVRCDSALEALAWLLMINTGAVAEVSSPYIEGWDRHPLIDTDGRALGTRLLGCLSWVSGDAEFTAFPQVTLRTHRGTYRVDCLVRVEIGTRVFWIVVEIDGDGHVDRYDDKRTQRLDTPVLRFTQKEVESIGFLPRLSAALIQEHTRLLTPLKEAC